MFRNFVGFRTYRLLLHFLNHSNGCYSEKVIAFRKFTTTTYTYTYLWSGVG